MIIENKMRIIYKIPIGNMRQEDAEKAISELISSYKEEVNLSDRKSKISKLLSKLNPLK